jgi:hypothetical protein
VQHCHRDSTAILLAANPNIRNSPRRHSSQVNPKWVSASWNPPLAVTVEKYGDKYGDSE